MVALYSKKDCQACVLTKRLLDSEGIKYELYNVDENEVAHKTVVDLGYQSLPVVIVDDDNRWSGFRPDLIKQLALSRM